MSPPLSRIMPCASRCASTLSSRSSAAEARPGGGFMACGGAATSPPPPIDASWSARRLASSRAALTRSATDFITSDPPGSAAFVRARAPRARGGVARSKERAGRTPRRMTGMAGPPMPAGSSRTTSATMGRRTADAFVARPVTPRRVGVRATGEGDLPRAAVTAPRPLPAAAAMDASTVAIEGTIAAATAHARMRRGRRRLAEDGGGDLPDGR